MLLTLGAVVHCGHEGVVHVTASQSWVCAGGSVVFVDPDPAGRRITGCPNAGPTVKPCTLTLAVQAGYSAFVRIGGRAVALSTVDGLTDGTVPGTVHYTVRDPGQSWVGAGA